MATNSGNYSQALELIDRALEYNPKDIIVMDTKALLLLQLNKNKEAINWYDKVLAAEPAFFPSLNNKGVALSNLGQYEEAIKWYDKALAEFPDHSVHYSQ